MNNADYHDFNFDLITKFILAASYPNLTIISVGSGAGVLEKHLQSVIPNKIICVDPNPQSFQAKPIDWTKGVKPDYPTVIDLIKAQPNLKNNSIILLAWPTPNDSNYDYEAIDLIKPTGIILIYELIGAAGGTKLHCMLKKSDQMAAISSQNLLGLSYHDIDIGCDNCQQQSLNVLYRPMALTKVYNFKDFGQIPSISCLLWLAVKGSRINSNLKTELVELTKNSYSLIRDIQLLDNHKRCMTALMNIYNLIK